MKIGTKILKSHALFLALFLIIPFLLHPVEVYAGNCSISGPGIVSGTLGAPLSFNFTGSNANPNSLMRINFVWAPSSVPGIASTNNPAEGTAKSILYTFSGVPGAIGTYTYTATVHDDDAKCTDVSIIGSVTISAPPVVVINTNAIPDGQVGVAYNATIVASGGVLPYGWTNSGFPAGLIFNIVANNLVITGTPNAGTTGTYNAVVTVNDSVANTDSKTYALTILPAVAPLDISTISIPDGTVSTPYTYGMTGTGGTPPYSWSAVGLPAGLSINAAGVITGTPTTAGTVNSTITITDSALVTTNKIYAFNINPAAVVATSSMSDFCITPPFISPAPKPNLLLMIDNSASMYDLFYVDKGSATRTAYYCYDETFSSANAYPGYFNETSIYAYDASDYRFEVSAFPIVCNKQVPSVGAAAHLCITGTNLNIGDPTPRTVTGFYASGKYLNWLTSSKFDVEKEILTGGKYDSGFQSLIAESRGCVGRRYIKEALTANYVEGGANTSLGITFGVRGPIDPSNPSAPSPGGLTSIDIFVGNYDEGACQTAIDAYSDPLCNQQCRRDATTACLQYDSHDTTLAGKASNTYIQSVQECYQYDQNGTVGDPDAANTVKNQCPDVLDHYSPGRCSVTTATVCTLDAECPGVEKCMVGPYAITAGNAALLCGAAYTGACYVGSAPYSKFGYTGTVDGYTGNDCIIYMHNKYCGDIKQPPVVDPTDDVSATDFYENVPAILGDVGLQSQLGNPIKSIEVRVENASPTGIIHDYKDRIRFGAISFDFNGSISECGKGVCSHNATIACTSDAVCGGTNRCLILTPCPKICSNDSSKTCQSFQDCPPKVPAATCDLVQAGNLYRDPITSEDLLNQDGAKVIAYIGDPTYASNPIGDHNAGLIHALDSIRAQTWTPYAEGFYNAIAYYTQNIIVDGRPTRINANDFNTITNPIQNSCQENNILLISDGMSTTDQHSDVMSFVNTYNDSDGEITVAASSSGSVAPKYYGSKNIDDLSWYAQNKNIFNPASTAAKKPKETIKTYVAYTGELCDLTSVATDCTSCVAADESKPERLMYETALNGAGTCNFAKDMPALETAIGNILEDIAGAAASGTAASVLASGEGSGANLVQAVFYPIKTFADTDIKWIGRLTNLWYYVDPLFGSSGIYEDNSGVVGPPYGTPNDYVLNITNDNRVSFAYDPVDKVTEAQRSKDTDNDGVVDTLITPDIPFENMAGLWDAGLELWKRASARTIKTTIGGGVLIDFSTANAAALMPYLQASNVTEAENIINYIHGIDGFGYRNRSVRIDLNKDGDYLDAGETAGNEKVWKLGDIIQSTPRIASRFALNSYDRVYKDSTYEEFVGDISPVAYRDRGLVFTGANDGMLHAFFLGKLELDGAWNVDPLKVYKKAKLADPLSVGYGKEVWSYIPKNVLPFLKFMADPNYCHVYSVDLSPYIFDASIGAPGSGDISNNVKTVNSWRTILVGGMRIGGACKKSDAVCTNCVKAPGVDLDASGTITTDAEKSLGLSTYFALDITNSLNHPDDPASYPPQLLWEFSDPSLGFTSTGASIVKINMKAGDTGGPLGVPDGKLDGYDTSAVTKNGKWFVVVGSGPTGPITTADHQFLGRSDQNLKIFIIDLKTGAVSSSITTAEAEAFAGSLINSTFDIDTDYQDDVVYVPYVKKTGTTWTAGGVGRLLTRESINPAEWTWSKVIEGIGPVTSAVSKLQDKRRGQLWLYFGTGRYFFEQEPPDDRTGQQAIYGVKDPCYSLLKPNFELTAACPALGALTNVTDIADVPTDYISINAMNGWYINLNSCSDSAGTALGDDPVVDCASSSVGYRTERMITDPLATTLGVVFFTTFKPKDNFCDPGGKSYIWASKYNTGGAAGGLLKGKAILQVSTGKIEEVDLQSQFSDEGGRRSVGMEGVPPTAQGLSIITSPPPVKRTIHMRER